jgi:hypothetical protein
MAIQTFKFVYGHRILPQPSKFMIKRLIIFYLINIVKNMGEVYILHRVNRSYLKEGVQSVMSYGFNNSRA